ncbi:MAG: NAD(P)/FAD-dependent oxidoreductase [Prevotella sp.]|jgi:predicted Rossmann fold flavoprotein|nr:NAD(P)/FAD-dependent oxidoreductase [Prevotella sp.]
MIKVNVAIVGGGASGFFAAIIAKSKNPNANVTIFEKNQKALAKVMITGGGRCNLTNTFEDISDLKHAYPRGYKLMKRLFKQFDYHEVYKWFEDNGVPLVTQEDLCVFPKSQEASSIVNCLVNKARRLGVNVMTGYKLEKTIQTEDGRFMLYFKNGQTQIFDRVAITTGGSPNINDLNHLRELGHEIETPIPSLFTFNIADKKVLALMGTVVNPVMTSISSTKFRSQGPLLVTHWGFSGPAILKLSSHAARYLHENNYNVDISVNWTNVANHSEIEEYIKNIVNENPNKQLASLRPYDMPSRLWTYIIDKLCISREKKWAELGKSGINRIIEALTNDIYHVSGKGVYRDEFVTCGGVSLSNIDYHTLESKICPHLFFAGEVLDIDAITGGFNLQAAWTTGYIVGQNIVE